MQTVSDNSEQIIKGIYLGDRGESFKTLITGVLKLGGIRDKYINLLTNEANMDIYASAFTSELVDENNNYQVLEQLGDLTGNKFIVWYIYERFPQLKCADGVKVAARLRINYGAKNSFCDIADKLGFWPFISATNDLRHRKRKPLLEDVFEAFIGATELILDEQVRHGVGYACVYKVLTAIFDGMNISLAYEDLYDAKTRLKELFDMHGTKLGPLVYEEKKEDTLTQSIAYRLSGANYEVRPDGSVNMNKITGRYTKVPIGSGKASLKSDAQQLAANCALKTLEKEGYVKKPPHIYAKFSGKYVQKPTEEKDVLRMCESKEKINDQFFTRGKSKYQNKYTSTALAMYCRKRDYNGIKACLKLGAKPNELDSEGLTCFDLLLIGVKKEKLIKKIFAKFSKNNNIIVHKSVYDVYGRLYDLNEELLTVQE
jgi:dsRNA-specific ribonuclease